MPPPMQEKNVKMFVTNATKLALKYNLGNKINNIISVYILKMLGCKEKELEDFKEDIKKTYFEKGEEIVNNNLSALTESDTVLRNLEVEKFTLKEEKQLIDNDNYVIKTMLKREGNNLKVSDFIKYKSGSFEGNTSGVDKRRVSATVPKWLKENCIQCGQCSFVCPHAVIRSYSLTDEELKNTSLNIEDTNPSLGEDNKHFYIGISEANCTACGLCEKVCPGKKGEKALIFGDYAEEKDKIFDEVDKVAKNCTPFKKETVKGLSFIQPVFEFSGACAGCGETPYLNLLTKLYKESIVIANATGCSSIYSASLPCTAYKIPWISSLFEDNAEFGLGIHTSYKNIRNQIKNIMYETKDKVAPEVKSIYKKFIDNMEDDEITKEVKKELEIRKVPVEIEKLMDYIPSRKVWIIGGDGWAYDIGYGGVDHVLASGENVKILVLDTEVYSNTGGQKSKATKTSAIAEFASSGKTTPKKDLFRIAMCTPNVYVASICLGADMQGAIKAFKEANEHNGPALIIAYSPCIAHGIKGGLNNSIEEEKLLVDSGYNLLMRYDGDKLYLDSKEPDFSLYEKVFARELRYKNLTILNENEYQELYKKNIENAKSRYEYFKNLSEK